MPKLSNEASAPRAPVRTPSTYATLRAKMKDAGLYERRRWFYPRKILEAYGLVAVSIVLTFLLGGWLGAVLGAVVMAFGFTLFGFVLHDAGHRQISPSPRVNDAIGLLTMNLTLGSSFGAWVEKHNAHHNLPNQIGGDPDLDLPTISFTEEEAREQRGFKRFLVRHQALFFIPTLTLLTASIRSAGIRFVVTKRKWLEGSLMVTNWALTLAFLLLALGPWGALLFIVVREAVLGVCLASTFAPNHKGMPVLREDEEVDFLHRQIVTARNIAGGPVVHFLYGGLDSQIEHHLFPTMPRCNLPRARPIVRRFCEDVSIPYYETGVLQSWREMLTYLHRVSEPLRN